MFIQLPQKTDLYRQRTGSHNRHLAPLHDKNGNILSGGIGDRLSEGGFRFVRKLH